MMIIISISLKLMQSSSTIAWGRLASVAGSASQHCENYLGFLTDGGVI
jgi:hypothetical protein